MLSQPRHACCTFHPPAWFSGAEDKLPNWLQAVGINLLTFPNRFSEPRTERYKSVWVDTTTFGVRVRVPAYPSASGLIICVRYRLSVPHFIHDYLLNHAADTNLKHVRVVLFVNYLRVFQRSGYILDHALLLLAIMLFHFIFFTTIVAPSGRKSTFVSRTRQSVFVRPGSSIRRRRPVRGRCH